MTKVWKFGMAIVLVCALALGPFVAFFTRYAAQAMVFGRGASRKA